MNNIELEKKETQDIKGEKEESESEEESDEEGAEESFGVQASDRVTNAQNYASVQSGISSNKDSKALMLGREPAQNRITQGGETERIEKVENCRMLV